jgi:hypothetical protein
LKIFQKLFFQTWLFLEKSFMLYLLVQHDLKHKKYIIILVSTRSFDQYITHQVLTTFQNFYIIFLYKKFPFTTETV